MQNVQRKKENLQKSLLIHVAKLKSIQVFNIEVLLNYQVYESILEFSYDLRMYKSVFSYNSQFQFFQVYYYIQGYHQLKKQQIYFMKSNSEKRDKRQTQTQETQQKIMKRETNPQGSSNKYSQINQQKETKPQNPSRESPSQRFASMNYNFSNSFDNFKQGVESLLLQLEQEYGVYKLQKQNSASDESKEIKMKLNFLQYLNNFNYIMAYQKFIPCKNGQSKNKLDFLLRQLFSKISFFQNVKNLSQDKHFKFHHDNINYLQDNELKVFSDLVNCFYYPNQKDKNKVKDLQQNLQHQKRSSNYQPSKDYKSQYDKKLLKEKQLLNNILLKIPFFKKTTFGQQVEDIVKIQHYFDMMYDFISQIYKEIPILIKENTNIRPLTNQRQLQIDQKKIREQIQSIKREIENQTQKIKKIQLQLQQQVQKTNKIQLYCKYIISKNNLQQQITSLLKRQKKAQQIYNQNNLHLKNINIQEAFKRQDWIDIFTYIEQSLLILIETSRPNKIISNN